MQGSSGEGLPVCFEGHVSFPAAGLSDGEAEAVGEAATGLWGAWDSLPAPRGGVGLASRVLRRSLSPVPEKDKCAI